MKSAADFSIGTVTLNVKSLDMMRIFYRDIIGLDILKDTEKEIVLGKTPTPLLKLLKAGHLDYSHPSHAGLYHFAILFSSRRELSKTIERIINKTPQFFTGSADHLVSEAFYFSDPEGNGIELYFDRERTEWLWENGMVKMSSVYIDPKEYIERYIVLEEQNSSVQMGHIHLKVGDISKAKKFYVDILGFDITAELPGALFVSFGGYHHHVGLNTWESFGAGEREEKLGLSSFEFVLSDEVAVVGMVSRLNTHHIQHSVENGIISFYDPWKNFILIRQS